jgi:uncharacterized protein (UPF0276 family)
MRCAGFAGSHGGAAVVAHSLAFPSARLRASIKAIAQIAEWRRLRDTVASDHLSSMHAQHHKGMEVNVGLMMPVPCDQASLEMLAGRIEHVRSTVEVPFLLENNTNYFTVPGEEMTEPEFLNALTRRSGCGLLLDLHNVYTNARNFGFDPYTFLAELDLTRVGEIHLSGGMELHGFYLDAHDGPCPRRSGRCSTGSWHVLRTSVAWCSKYSTPTSPTWEPRPWPAS